MAAFRREFSKAKNVVVLTGAGVSAESGVPTFRGAGGFWRKWQATVMLHLYVIHFSLVIDDQHRLLFIVICVLKCHCCAKCCVIV
jgi:NAD-dependent SIR2 family protein deacetylase